jgi:formate hydrogenlyase subunit 3/multisubunit Na+/H+ antiporter MnhD subunit
VIALFFAAVLLLGGSGLVAAALVRFGPRLAHRAAAALAVIGALSSAGAASWVLATGRTLAWRAPWRVPLGSLSFEIDSVSAVFLLSIAVLAGTGSVYGLRYYALGEKELGRALRLLVAYGLTAASLAVLVAARNGVLFLAAWESLAIGSFILVATEDHEAEAREASFVYIVTAHAGTLALFAAFALLAARAGSVDVHLGTSTPAYGASLDFDALAAGRGTHSPLDGAIFALLLFGCGSKAGIIPLHYWLPGAHAAAPSHVSALMSGVVIKMGVYGLLRVSTFLGDPPLSFGLVVFAAGVVSGVLGVAFALGQHDLKRLLAYHSIENVGIITMGIGLLLMGRTLHRPELVLLGSAGALLHTLNHGLFKSLLFLGAGSAIHGAGTREIDRLGGLAKTQRWTALFFIVGAAAISGLPPLNGFVSELYVYLGMFGGVDRSSRALAIACALGIPALALIGALAVACFVKVVGAVFLGEPRTEDAARAHESPRAMLVPMGMLAGMCLAIGLFPMPSLPPLTRAADILAPDTLPVGPLKYWQLRATFLSITEVAILFGSLLTILAALRSYLLRERTVAHGPTWDCGYARPTHRMQYTASSFAQIIVDLFAPVLRPHAHAERPLGVLPRNASYSSHVPELVLDGALQPAGRAVEWVARHARRIQQGRIQTYLLYVLLTLVTLLGWRSLIGDGP